MIQRYSSRLQRLDETFLNKKLANAKNYDRIAGYFCSSVLEVAGEQIEAVSGQVRVICNSGLKKEDVEAAVCAERMRQEWCFREPENTYGSPAGSGRLARLYRLLKRGKMKVRVIPDEVYGLIHGKAGVITYEDGAKTSFLGSINETRSAFQLNYELVWEDDSLEAVEWIQKEFDYFWYNSYAVELCDFVVEDIGRISRRTTVPLVDWRKLSGGEAPSVAVEEPVYRKEMGLWEHQKYFVELAFREHQKDGGARFLLADQVGLGKTVQLALAAKLMALYGDKPILIVVPKTLALQWQDEMKTLLDMPSAVWTGKGWQDETGYCYPAESAKAILNCPRRVGIVSQGLAARRTEAAGYLLQNVYECVIIDEAHRARRRNPGRDPDKNKAEPNVLLWFLNEISARTRSLLLASATPVQVNTIEVYDLVSALGISSEKVMGNRFSEWHRKPQKMLDIVCGKELPPESEIDRWNIIRNPFPCRSPHSRKINSLRDAMDVGDATYVLPPFDVYRSYKKSMKDKIETLYTADDFVHTYNPYIRHIVRRTRHFLENTINPATNDYYLKKINVQLYGEGEKDALPLDGYLRQAYQRAEGFTRMLSKRVKTGGFLSTLMLKRIGSTMLAGEYTARKMLGWTEEGGKTVQEELAAELEEEDDFCEEKGSEVKKLTQEERQCLEELVQILSLNRDRDPKYGRVFDLLQKGVDGSDSPWKTKGCIIFSQYYDSARYIAETLSNDMADTMIGLYAGGDRSGYYLNGRFTRETKDTIKMDVKMWKLRILVGTDAASEGLNLQMLSTLINLDLPWNPTRLEQRKGRIQRIGQVRDTVQIFNLRYKGSVEDKVHSVLSDRMNDIYNLFGQIPDTLEDVWVDLALDNMEKAKERLDRLPKQNPFAIKYETVIPETGNWEMCAVVLDKKDKDRQLMKGWQPAERAAAKNTPRGSF